MTSPFIETSGVKKLAGFAELAAAGPLHHQTIFTGVPVWLVTGYPETRELLAHPDVVRAAGEGPHRRSQGLLMNAITKLPVRL